MMWLLATVYILIGFGTYCFIIYDDYTREMRTFNRWGSEKPDLEYIVQKNMGYFSLILIWPIFWVLYLTAYLGAGIGFVAIMIVEAIYNYFYKPKD